MFVFSVLCKYCQAVTEENVPVVEKRTMCSVWN